MRFERPEAWWLLALALPLVVAHLHLRRRVQVEVSSVDLWRDLVPAGVGRGWMRQLRDRVALALLLVALAAFSAAAARPTAGISASAPRRLAIVLDASASMNAREARGDVTRFSDAVAAARVALERTNAADDVVVWLATDEPRVLAEPSRDHAVVRAALDAAKPTLRPSGIVATTRLALRSASGLAGRGADVLVLTDAVGADALAAATIAASDGVALHVGVVGAGDEMRRANASVVDAAPDAANPGTFLVHVAATDYAGGERPPAAIVLRRNGEDVATAGIAWTPDGTAQIRIPSAAFATRGGIAEVALVQTVSGDAFPEDDALRFAMPSSKPLVVAVVADAPPRFLVEALRAMPDVVDAQRTTLVSPGAPRDAFNGVDVVIADGVAPPADIPSLAFVAAGSHVAANPLLWAVGTHAVLAGADLSPLRIERAAVLDVAPGDATIAATAEGAVGVAGERDGRRFVTFGFRPDASTLPLEAAFPLLVRNALRWLARTPTTPACVVADEPLPGDAGERGEVAPYPPPGGPYDLRVTIDGTACDTVVRWRAPRGFHLDSDGRVAAPDAREAVASLVDRSADVDTREDFVAWFAALGAAALVAGAALLRPRESKSEPPPAPYAWVGAAGAVETSRTR